MLTSFLRTETFPRAALEAKRNEGNMTPFGQNMDVTELDHGQDKPVVFR